MAVTNAEFKDVKETVCEHEKFINGVNPNGQDGAKSRMTRVEDVLDRRNKASNYIIGACITIITAVIIWLVTSVIPVAVSNYHAMASLIK